MSSTTSTEIPRYDVIPVRGPYEDCYVDFERRNDGALVLVEDLMAYIKDYGDSLTVERLLSALGE